MKKIILYLLLFIFTLVFCISCNKTQETSEHLPGSQSGSGDSSGKGDGGGKDLKDGATIPLTVYAASSVQNSLNEIISEFKKDYKVVFNLNYASSGQLASQILQGAPADIFLSANYKWMNVLKEDKMVFEASQLLGNSLVIVVPKGSTLKINSAKDLLREDVANIAIADTKSVPAGMYAKEALDSLGLFKKLNHKLISTANVRIALSYVERGEVPAAIVYNTDALLVPNKVDIVHRFNPKLHKTIEYPFAILNNAKENGMARKFFKFLKTNKSYEIFRKYGFVLN